MHFLHADDYGLSKGITDAILACIDEGIIDSLSIIPNGHAFDYAIAEWKKRPHVRLAVHLNLAEGTPMDSRISSGHLVNAKGRFFHSFFTLWLRYLCAFPRTKAMMRQQVRDECAAQLRAVAHALGRDARIYVDSHQHFHMIPFVFEALLSLREKLPIRYVRIPEEPFFFVWNGPRSLKNYAGPNLVKHWLINFLICTLRYKTRLRNKGIEYCTHFIGVLFTGNMNAKVLAHMLRKTKGGAGVVEYLFHPGKAARGETHLWDDYPKLRRYYYAEGRDRERRELTIAAETIVRFRDTRIASV